MGAYHPAKASLYRPSKQFAYRIYDVLINKSKAPEWTFKKKQEFICRTLMAGTYNINNKNIFSKNKQSFGPQTPPLEK